MYYMPFQIQSLLRCLTMFTIWLWHSVDSISLLLFGLFVFVLIIYNLENWCYFSRRNVKFIRGWPVIGSLHEFFFGNKSFYDVTLKFYRQFPNESFFGIYELTHPVYVIRDPDVIKQITVQDFNHFFNHQGNFDVDIDPLIARSLFFLRNQQWKRMRSILSPAFTGNKLRLMFELIRSTTIEFMNTLKTTIEDNQNGFEIEQKDLLSRYATNVIATSAFGLKVDAVSERSNEFFLAGKEITNFEGIQGVKLLALDVFPNIIKWLGIEFLNRKVCDYFRNVVNTAIAYRDKNNVHRPDMIHLLMTAKKGTLNEDDIESSASNKMDWVDDDLVAQCLVFFFGGSETTSTLLSFMGHELACNPDIQQRLYEQIAEIEQNLNGEAITYEMINDFKYMDMIVSETLRRWPPIPNSDRQVTKPYVLRGKNGVNVPLTTNDDIWISINGLHMDPEYWPEPDRFDPERFNDDNRKNIRSGTFLPFGSGRRSCIAPRFALMMDAIRNGWFSEISEEMWPGQCFSLRVKKILHEERSQFQDIKLIDTEAHGRTLILDGVIQCTEKDEFSYQEMISFIPLCIHPNPENVLIVGGGDGGVAREVVKHPGVETVHQVEIDSRVVELSKEYMPYMACGFDSPKVTLTVGDGFEFMKQHSGEFDVIITDSSDPVGPAESLFQESYFALMRQALKPNGIICSQGGSYWTDAHHVKSTLDHCRKQFPMVGYAVTSVPSYPCGQIGFVIGSLNPSVDLKTPHWTFSDTELDNMNIKYYSAENHRAAFESIPRSIAKQLKA